MTPELDPLSAESLAILAEAEIPEPPPEAEFHVLSRLRVELPPSERAVVSRFGSLGGPVAVASLVVGLALGALLHARFAPAVVVTEVRTIEVPPAPLAVAPVTQPTPKPAAYPLLPKAAPKAPEPGRDVALADERSLIEQARSALVRGEARLAMDALSKHAVLFPNGRLAEERESLLVQALVNAGDFSSAYARAKHFSTTFPNSLLAPVVEAAVQSIPQ
jgi:hypothetical protein